MPDAVITRWDQLPADIVDGVSRTAFAGTGAELKRIVLPAGTMAPRHEHDHEQFLLVLEGRADLTTSRGTFVLEPGVTVHFPPHTWHEAAFHESTVLVEVNLK